MALLSSYAYKNPIYREIVGTKKYKIQTDKKSYSWTNRNKLLFTYKYAAGGKTGYTPSAGRTLVTNASKDNFNLTAVTLNDGNEYISHKEMYDYGFDNYKVYKILDKGKFKVDSAYYKNKIYIKKDFSYPLTGEIINITEICTGEAITKNEDVKSIMEQKLDEKKEEAAGGTL